MAPRSPLSEHFPEDPQQRAEMSAPQRPSPEEIKNTFITAVKACDYDAMSAALEQGADINTEITERRHHHRSFDSYERSYYTYTHASTIFYALGQPDEKLLRFLIAHGADINRPDENKTSALTKAIYQENKSLAKIIMAAPGFDRSLPSNKVALQLADNAKHKGPVQKELYRYVNSILSDQWQLVDDDTVSRVSFDKDGMLEVTDQFNFKAGERIRHVRDFEFGTIQTSACFFVNMPANMRTQLKEAWDELKAAGGGKNVDPQIMNTTRVRQVARRIEKPQ